MKSYVFVVILLSSFSTYSSEYLIKKVSSSGFSPIPTSRVLKIFEDGKVTQAVTLITTKKTTVTELKVLSPNVIQALKDSIDLVDVKLPLVDLDQAKPKCMDAPSNVIFISKNKKNVEIANWFSCHKSQMKTKSVTNILNIITEVENK